MNTSTLLLSTDANTLFVGARDALLSLDVSQSDSITLKDKVIVMQIFLFSKLNLILFTSDVMKIVLDLEDILQHSIYS